MDILDDTTYRLHRRIISLGNAEPMASTSGYRYPIMFTPDRVTAQWYEGEPLQYVTVGGQHLKKDGTPGRAYYQRKFRLGADEDIPQWLSALFQ